MSSCRLAATPAFARPAQWTRTLTDGPHKHLDYRKKSFIEPLLVEKKGVDLIHDPIYNKGTAYPYSERDRLNIRGLVPPRCTTIEEQAKRVKTRFDHITDDLQKYSYISNLRDRNETLFYRMVMDNIDEMAPIIYTPTVGKACIEFGSQFRRARGMYFSSADVGQMSAMIYNWPEKHVDVIVVTDGSRILGLGDLGAHGMGIPIGKLSLYVAAGGIHPARTLPVTLDVGTNNEKLLDDPFYLGRQHRRLTGEDYYNVIEEFMSAVKLRWPSCLVQFEDFSNANAANLLEKYRDRHLCFNDDIQGTGSVALAGILTALRAQGKAAKEITKQRIVCLGGGSAGLGVINSLIDGMVEEGLSREVANKNVWVVDADGLIAQGRSSISDAQKPFVRTDLPNGLKLKDTVDKVKPTILLGLSGAGRTFTEDVVRSMAANTERPIIFPLSNPTDHAECTAEEAFTWTDGRAIVASGSPFDPVQYNGKTYYPSQGNNMYIYPGIGLGVVCCRAKKVTNAMFYAAAKKLASIVPEEDVQAGRVYPDIAKIREVSKQIAIEVCKEAFASNLATIHPPKNERELEYLVENAMYIPEYAPLVHAPNIFSHAADPNPYD